MTPKYDIPEIPEGYELFFRMTQHYYVRVPDEASLKGGWKYDRLHNYIKQKDGKGNVYVYRIGEDSVCTSERWSLRDGARYCEPGASFDPRREVAFVRNRENTWKYDSRGNCIERINRMDDPCFTTYDEHGRVLTEKGFFKDGKLWADKHYSYDEAGNLTEYWEDMLEINNGHGDYQTMHYLKRVSEFDESGRKISERDYNREGELIGEMNTSPDGRKQISTLQRTKSWKVRTEYDLDGDGRVVTEFFILNDRPQSRTETVYHEDGSRDVKWYSSILEKNNELMLREDKTYDAEDRIVREIEYAYGKDVVLSEYYAEYDKDGNLTRKVLKRREKAKPHKEYANINLFGEVGGFKHKWFQLKSFTTGRDDPGIWEHRFYFPDGNTAMDFSICKNEVTYVTFYRYDDYGNLLSVYHSDEEYDWYGKEYEYTPFLVPKGSVTKETREEEEDKLRH